MKGEDIRAIERQLAEVPQGYVLKTAPNGVRQLFVQDEVRGKLETLPLFPGLSFSHLSFLGDTLPHRHAAPEGALELTHCRRGRAGWALTGGLTLYLGPGDLSLQPMRCCARSVLRFPLGYYEGFSLSLDPAVLEEDLPEALALGGVTLPRLLEKFCPLGKPAAFPARPALDHIFRPLYDLPPALYPAYCRLKAQELLLYLSQAEPPGETASQQYLSQQTELVREIHDDLMAHPDRRTTIEALAREHHLNASTLKAVFKAVYGQPIAAHMKYHRMQEAARLLRETDRSIGEIAQQVGYESQSKFSSVFRDTFQVLPTEYRKQQANDGGARFLYRPDRSKGEKT